MTSRAQPSVGRRGHVIKHRARPKTGAVPPEPRCLPVVGHMAPTYGSRREDCASYSDCLTAHVVGHPRSDPPASCPTGCRWYALRTERATEYMAAPCGGPIAQAIDARPW